jgi:hypothetical protein
VPSSVRIKIKAKIKSGYHLFLWRACKKWQFSSVKQTEMGRSDCHYPETQVRVKCRKRTGGPAGGQDREPGKEIQVSVRDTGTNNQTALLLEAPACSQSTVIIPILEPEARNVPGSQNWPALERRAAGSLASVEMSWSTEKHGTL